MTDNNQGRSQGVDQEARTQQIADQKPGGQEGNHKEPPNVAGSTGPCTTLVIGDRRLKIAAIATRLQQEVTALQLRIATIAAQPEPNTAALQAYEELLQRRLTVLSWLSQYYEA